MSVSGANPARDRLSDGETVLIVGAGPAGLTAAMELQNAGVRSIVFEKESSVGGLARTVYFKGNRFDIGGHRFFTRVRAIDQLWREVLGSNFIRCSRLSRIIFNGKYFDYPLRLSNVIRGLGTAASSRALISYAMGQMQPIRPEVSFEDWVTNKFGRYLYETFFKGYTEKVWGMPCTVISADWAAQRIRGLSFSRALSAALIPRRSRQVRSLVDAFDYPRLGPGQMWESARSRIDAGKGAVFTDAEVVSIRHNGTRIEEIAVAQSEQSKLYPAHHVVSSLPLRDLVDHLDPPAPEPVRAAARCLRYRDFITVALIIDGTGLFPDNWIYVHDAGVKVARIQNFGNWSNSMVADPGRSCIGMEYFCCQGDCLWTMDDRDLLLLAAEELRRLKITDQVSVVDGKVVRAEKAYPVYDLNYSVNVEVIRRYLDGLVNLQCVGRNGLHKYNNQDHSMLTAMLAVRNLLGENHDLWSVNADCEAIISSVPTVISCPRRSYVTRPFG